MATNTSLCAICDLRHLTKSSTHWCPECEEALCADCKEHHILSKASRVHHVIPISDYNNLPPFIASIDLFCTYHNEKYTQYCVKHEVPICYKCIKEHGNCSGFKILEDLTVGAKSSEVFRDMEQSLKDIMGNIRRIREDRESNIKIIKDKKKQIIDDVSLLKKQINRHLDKLQEDFMKELNKVEAECCEKIQTIVSSLNDQEQDMIQCNAEIENMKMYASDIQAFLGMREIQKKITKNETCVQSIFQYKNVQKIGLNFSIDRKIHDFLTNVKTFGSTMVDICSSDSIELVRKKDRQAQILVADQSVNNINFTFKRKLKTSCAETTGCCITAKCGYLFTDYNDKDEKLVALDSYGKTEYTINLGRTYSAFDLVCIDDNTVAVTTGTSNGKTGVIILDLITRKIKRFVELPGTPFGITFDCVSFIWCCTNTGIFMISCTYYSFINYTSRLVSQFSYIATHGDRIICTAPSENTVSCLDRRKLVWKFKNETVLENPRGITVDDKGNVFVVGIDSKNIVVISPNGKQYKQIQTKEYNLTEPSTIFFDKIKK